MDVRFGTVLHARFKTEKGGTLRSDESQFKVAQQVLNHSDTALGSTEGTFAIPIEQGGKTTHQFYFVENGPKDTDGTDFNNEAVAINDKWAAIRRQNVEFLPSQRQELAGEQIALSTQYAAKAEPKRIDILMKADGTYEKGKITPLKQ